MQHYAIEALRSALGDDIAEFALRNELPLVSMWEDASPLGTSRLGGAPDLAAGEQWPSFGERAVFLGQIDFSELPVEIHERHAMPRAGVLRLFTPTESDQETGQYPLVATLFTTADTIEGDLSGSIPVRFEYGMDLPEDSAQCEDWPWAEASEEEDTYSEICENQHSYQYLFGYPWPAGEPNPAGTVPLLTLFSEEAYWLEGEVLQLFITPEDLAAGNFSNLRAEIRQPY
ncbi:hypothetical protein CKALI_07825 [Corynebacterium kalinowskii]|uniref:DUF1963 domain-containing protein n=1 Tax=Corynebacterium kalinowskii TaxID=2675216 RepID=A0A6B8VS23_9CORY|nr:DUF1963 domain-containing protein [Corynebacterium kalinowskii]QGU02427.1 hypothetical protein CKALI_07825 [Corynebacterium kalinowskii]